MHYTHFANYTYFSSRQMSAGGILQVNKKDEASSLCHHMSLAGGSCAVRSKFNTFKFVKGQGWAAAEVHKKLGLKHLCNGQMESHNSKHYLPATSFSGSYRKD